MSRAFSIDSEKDKQKRNTAREPAAPKMGICDKCHKEALLRSYRTREMSMSDGAASFGTVVKHLCEDCAPRSKRFEDANVPAMDKKQVKNLMRSAKKGLL
jgi:RNase P subunit RPR2